MTFLTRNQLKELGNEIHEVIGDDFVSQNRSLHRADFKRKGEGLTVGRILKEADGLPKGNFPFNGLRPDLADYGTREIYEIKSLSRYADAYLELFFYEAALNRAPGQKNQWQEGSSYIYNHSPIILKYGKIAMVNPPVFGVITYNLLDNQNSQSSSSISTAAAVTTMALLIALLIAAAARNSAAPGAAGAV